MRKILPLILLSSSIFIAGCFSIPQVANYKELYSVTRVETKEKGMFARGKILSIKDFRENEIYDEDVTALKAKIEKYIANHTELTEPAKNNLRALKVTEGAAKEEVKLLLGEPDRIVKRHKEDDIASEVWTYKINKSSPFTVVFLPVFFGHEEYHLYLKDNILVSIERHYLKQTFYSSDSGMGVQGRK